MTQFKTISEVMSVGGEWHNAVSAPERQGLTYGDLRELAGRTADSLKGWGIGANDPVAIVLPNGPEMATSFVAIAGVATAAPLNPAYRSKEFEFYLSDLEAKALVVAEGMDTPARAVAVERDIPIINLVPGIKAGDFTLKLKGQAPGTAADAKPSVADDVALVLHTSGTTSRPKIVPLTQTNICASAGNVRATLNLTADDKCLNIMPLFHIHGLIATVLSTFATGAEICCTPGFNALKFFAWMDEVQPTWYSAVPTMHQAILSRAPRNVDSVAQSKLRFVRSSSASLPPQVMAELEKTFNCPVVEAYGMTEAAHQMASNPLPPADRKPGTVGLPGGPEISIMEEGGTHLEQGATGEIVIRGPNVTLGYQNNPKANAEGFTDGWFRTGDQGFLDTDGYLTITGRIKEIINRGGEKISPREVDEILMDHPAVGQAVTFALPHDKLGEDVAAAIVLKEGENADDKDIRDFAADRLADFKVPRKIVILEEIPTGATGKMQRIGLAEKLGLA